MPCGTMRSKPRNEQHRSKNPMLITSYLIKQYFDGPDASSTLGLGQDAQPRSGKKKGEKYGEKSGKQIARSGTQSESGPSEQPKSGFLSTDSTAGIVWIVLIVVIIIILYIGQCTIFARSNPRIRGLALGVIFVLFLLFGDIYLLWFTLRWGIIGIQGLAGRKVNAYETLPYPRQKYTLVKRK